MRRRLTLSSRLLLIVLGSLVLLGTASVVALNLRDWSEAHRSPARYPRIRQAAAIIGLVATAPATQIDAISRAGSGVDLKVRLSNTVPPAGAYIRAPRLEALIERLSRSHTPLNAYINPRFHPRRDFPAEGFLARAVARLPDGRFLVIENDGAPDPDAPRLFGVGASLWLGGLAVSVTLVALWATRREMRPLHDLANGVKRFDGSMVTVAPLTSGAKDIHSTSLAVIAMQERVIELMGERSLIIGAISHDLRTLLTRMRLRVEALADDAAQVNLEGDLEGMEAMLSDGLAFARGTAAGAIRTGLDLADLVAAELADRQVRAEPFDIESRLEDAPTLGDPHALRRVIANLLDNAMKFANGRILVTAAVVDGCAQLTVEDDGPGIRPDQREVMLRPYRRGDDLNEHGLAGSGLGLAIVQQIVRSHHGAVVIAASELGGAMVIVRLSQAARASTYAG